LTNGHRVFTSSPRWRDRATAVAADDGTRGCGHIVRPSGTEGQTARRRGLAVRRAARIGDGPGPFDPGGLLVEAATMPPMERTWPTLAPLSAEDLARVHDAALRVLEEVGARIMTEEGRTLLLDHGGTLEGEDVVRIPPDVVERALQSSPKRLALFDRGGAPALRLGEGNVFVGAGVTNLNYLNPRTDAVEPFTLEATAESTLLADALPHIGFVATPGVTRATDDMPQHVVNQREFVEMVTNTTKPLMVLIAGGPELADIYDMAEVVAGGPDALREKPFVIPYLNSVSPLVFNPETVDKLFVAADRGLPVCCQAAPQVGATGPATIAGTLVISAAETLMGLVLAQLRRPGLPFVSGTVPFLMDMRSGAVTAGGPDGLRFMAAMSQVCRRWGLPLVGMSFGGDSKAMDEQAALETMYYGFGVTMAGVDLVFDAGCLEGGLLFSPELLAIADEAVEMARRATEPVEVSDETIAFETIQAVGPGGLYLGEPHTLKHFRELWLPKLLAWEPRQAWQDTGAKTLRERAKERVLRVWGEHSVPSLPEDVLAGMTEIVEARRDNPPE
ncbi:MAG TPA: trimethylamine methyltransferase family protein, partial [Actinomycetota bacterium]